MFPNQDIEPKKLAAVCCTVLLSSLGDLLLVLKTVCVVRDIAALASVTHFDLAVVHEAGEQLPEDKMYAAMPYCIKLFTASLKKHLKKTKKYG